MSATRPPTQEFREDGQFIRQPNRFTDRIALDSQSSPGRGPDSAHRWPVEAGRYQLVVSLACPWAHREVIVRRLLGLEAALGLSVVDPVRDGRGWRFTLDEDGRDPATGLAFLAEAYLRTDPGYDGRVTVPAVIDTLTGLVVTNDYPRLTLDLSTEWRALHAPGAPDLYPERFRDRIDQVNGEVFGAVNNGVYRCGFATRQAEYERAYRRLFDRLDELSARLAGQRYLCGDTLTEADVRLFTTLVRFDAVYHGHFKCNRSKLTELPVLWAYARDLYQTPGFGDSTDFGHIKAHYYLTHPALDPTGIVPVGPDEAGWLEPHGRG